MSSKKENIASENEVTEEMIDQAMPENSIEDEDEDGTTEQGEVESTDQQIALLEDELAAAKDSLLRKAAELENVRKRVHRERISLFQEAKVRALEDFLPINDDLIRTLSASENVQVEENFLAGVKLIADKFKNVLDKHGIERIDETGVPFDVNLHDALLRQPSPDEQTPSDTVLQVLEMGYKMENKIIKHAKVIVSE